jgi:flagellar protein FlaI
VVKQVYPFTIETSGVVPEEHFYRCTIYRGISKALQRLCQENAHLMEYLHQIPVEEIGIPEYYPELSRKLSTLEKRNLIYPVGEGVFTHICPDIKQGDRDFYISVEPCTTLDLDELSKEVERRLIDFAEAFMDVDTEDDRRKVLLECIEKICAVHSGGVMKLMPWSRFFKRNGNGNGHKGGRLYVTERQLDGLKYLIVRNKVGVGILEPLMMDSNIEDISGSGLGHVFIEHKIFKSLKTATYFETHEELDEFALRLGERVKHPLTLRNPIADATLPDGSRINIVYGRDVSKRGTSFSIRKFSEHPLSILELVGFNSLNYSMAAYLSLVIEDGMNVFVCGETASGKTTLLNAVTTFIPPQAKVISIEDTPELQVPHNNWLREVTKFSKATNEGGAQVTMFDLLKAALRQRPDEIIIGEIRGAEGNVAFQAMQTGHAVMSTFHAASVEKLIQRLVGDPINVPRTYVDNLNVVVIQNQVKLPDGKKGRRATSISEIIGYDPIAGSFNFVEVFRWNPATDEFEFTGNLNSYLLEQRIALKRGFPPERRRQIYVLLQKRARILQKLHKEKKVTDFYELLQVLAKAQREGIF